MGLYEDRYKSRSIEHSFFRDQPSTKDKRSTAGSERLPRYSYRIDSDGNLVREVLTGTKD